MGCYDAQGRSQPRSEGGPFCTRRLNRHYASAERCDITEPEVELLPGMEPPFKKLRVRLKKEIVTIGVEDKKEADPLVRVGQYVKPKDWNSLIKQSDVTLVDTRNDYEIDIGALPLHARQAGLCTTCHAPTCAQPNRPVFVQALLKGQSTRRQIPSETFRNLFQSSLIP